jgi:RNA polymerase sigma-70 factor (sigma-E family)
MEETANVALGSVREPFRLMFGSRMDDLLLQAVYERESPSLVGMLWVFTGDKAAAEDLAQEAFVRLALHWHRVQDPEKAGAYLRSVAFNLARSHHRRATTARLHQPPPVSDTVSAETTALLNETERQLLVALRALPDRQRECLVLRFYADLEPLQIAATLNLSVNSVKTHLRRGLDGLRSRIGDER